MYPHIALDPQNTLRKPLVWSYPLC